MYLVQMGIPGPGVVPGPRGVYLVLGGVPRGCTWSGGVYLVWGVQLVLGGVPGPGGCTWSPGGVPAQVLPPL